MILGKGKTFYQMNLWDSIVDKEQWDKKRGFFGEGGAKEGARQGMEAPLAMASLGRVYPDGAQS